MSRYRYFFIMAACAVVVGLTACESIEHSKQEGDLVSPDKHEFPISDPTIVESAPTVIETTDNEQLKDLENHLEELQKKLAEEEAARKALEEELAEKDKEEENPVAEEEEEEEESTGDTSEDEYEFTATYGTFYVVPQVKEVSPPDQAMNQPLSISGTFGVKAFFNKPMDKDSVIANFYLMEKDTGSKVESSVVSLSSDSFLLAQKNYLKEQTYYTAVITTEAKDIEGHNLAEAKRWTFKTGTASAPTTPGGGERPKLTLGQKEESCCGAGGFHTGGGG